MGNYNPRQITQMRWRDAKNLEKFIKGQIALYDIEISNGNTYNFDAVPEAKELAEKIRYCYDNQIPMTIYVYNNDIVYYTESLSDNSRLNLIRVSNDIKTLGYIQTYDDRIEITITDEETLTKDNVKSVFNQSIIGTGNITLFRHKLKISDMSSTGVRDIILDYLSTSNLNVDSLQDLQTLLNVSRSDTSDTVFLGYLGVKNYSITYKYSTGLFVLSDGTTDYTATSVSDKVKPL